MCSQSASVTRGFMVCPPPVPGTTPRITKEQPSCRLAHFFRTLLRKDLPIWPVFVEVTERRNLFAHCSGKVSAQYLTVCDNHGVKFDGKPPCLNDALDVTPE